MNRRSFFRKIAGAAASIAIASSIECFAFKIPKFLTLKERFSQAIVDVWEDRDQEQYLAMSRDKAVASGAVFSQVYMRSNCKVWIQS